MSESESDPSVRQVLSKPRALLLGWKNAVFTTLAKKNTLQNQFESPKKTIGAKPGNMRTTPSKGKTKAKNRKRKLEESLILDGFNKLEVPVEKFPPYRGAEEFGRQFSRCSKTQFVRVTYSAGSQ